MSITASDGNIRLTKPREVLGASAIYGPVFGCLVIGRPDFVQEAINEAPAISQEMKPYKLMTISALAELYVLWREAKISPDEVEGFLLQGEAYLNLERAVKTVCSRYGSFLMGVGIGQSSRGRGGWSGVSNPLLSGKATAGRMGALRFRWFKPGQTMLRRGMGRIVAARVGANNYSPLPTKAHRLDCNDTGAPGPYE